MSSLKSVLSEAVRVKIPLVVWKIGCLEFQEAHFQVFGLDRECFSDECNVQSSKWDVPECFKTIFLWNGTHCKSVKATIFLSFYSIACDKCRFRRLFPWFTSSGDSSKLNVESSGTSHFELCTIWLSKKHSRSNLKTWRVRGCGCEGVGKWSVVFAHSYLSSFTSTSSTFSFSVFFYFDVSRFAIFRFSCFFRNSDVLDYTMSTNSTIREASILVDKKRTVFILELCTRLYPHNSRKYRIKLI